MSELSHLDPRTPVLVGGGQASERIGEPDYQRLSAVDLGAAAGREALLDSGADPSVLANAIDVVAGIRQFETSTPFARAPLGRADNYPRAVARRLGSDPARAVLEVSGGQGPQHLVTEFADAIAAGTAEVVLLVGSEALSTTRHLANADDRPDFTEVVGGPLEDRGYGLAGISSRHLGSHGLTGAPSQYALFDNARRARLGQSRSEYLASIGELFAPFTRVAAGNPHASAPVVRSASELVSVTETNRLIAEPYTRYVVARDQVNQGASVLLTSIGQAARLGIPRDRWVFVHGHADLREPTILKRPDLSRAPSALAATELALAMSGIKIDDVTTLDLYSCFPIAVFNLLDGLGLSADDPRGLTLTGGLPFFGGAGNNYSMHAVVETLHRMRAQPGTFGFVGANGGTLSKYSVGIYSTTPVPWQNPRSAPVQAELDATPPIDVDRRPAGQATVETYTVRYDRDGGRTGIVIGRLDADGRRFVARVARGDEDLLGLLTHGDPVGAPVFARTFATGALVTATRDTMTSLHPVTRPGLRDSYEHVLVKRAGHVLEVTINRPEVRNALHPPANEELDDVFNAFFDDEDLWVAILVGAGDQAFSAGNDLAYTASGKRGAVPLNGFAGLTSRPHLPKPVIAAVNGYALGGGCEIALACHLVVADSTAQFALSEVRVGLVAGAGGLIRLPRTVPPKVANEMVLTGRRISASEAEQWGLANRVVPAGEALAGARALATEILAGSPTSVRTSLRIMADTDGIADTNIAVNQPGDALDDLMLSEDAMEGMRAFAEKRAPDWRNR